MLTRLKPPKKSNNSLTPSRTNASSKPSARPSRKKTSAKSKRRRIKGSSLQTITLLRRKMMVKLKAILMIKTMHLMSVMLKPMLMKIDQVWLQETREPSKELKIEMLLQHHRIY